MQAVYKVTDGSVETGASAAGPWDPALQHGAAPAALVAWAAERIETREPMRIARLTLDLLRPVPVAPMQIRSDVVRQGRKIQLVSIGLVADGVEVVRASALKVRLVDSALPGGADDDALDLPGPDQCADLNGEQRIRCPFLEGISARLATGRQRRPGPTAMWFHAHRPIVDGDWISPVMRAAIAADFCNGVSSPLDISQWSFINGDLTLNLVRAPIGEWILVNARTSLSRDGAGLAVAQLGDANGYFGRAAQSLIIERRGAVQRQKGKS
jgi:Thioesterase-like superfamily